MRVLVLLEAEEHIVKGLCCCVTHCLAVTSTEASAGVAVVVCKAVDFKNMAFDQVK